MSNRGSSMQNGLIDPITLIFDFLTPKAYYFEQIPSSFTIPSLNTLGSFLSYAADKQTNRQTDRQTVSYVLPTPTDIVGNYDATFTFTCISCANDRTVSLDCVPHSRSELKNIKRKFLKKQCKNMK